MQLPLPAPQISQGGCLPSEHKKPHSEGAREREEEFWEVSCPKTSLGLVHSPSAKLEQVSHCWGWSCSHPLEGPGAGTALPREQPASPSCLCPSESLPAAVAVPHCAPHVLPISWENKAGCPSTGALPCARGRAEGGPGKASRAFPLHTAAVAGRGHPSQPHLTPLHTILFSIQLSKCISWACSVSQIDSHTGTAVPQKPNPFAWRSRRILFIPSIILLKAQPRGTFPLKSCSHRNYQQHRAGATARQRQSRERVPSAAREEPEDKSPQKIDGKPQPCVISGSCASVSPLLLS